MPGGKRPDNGSKGVAVAVTLTRVSAPLTAEDVTAILDAVEDITRADDRDDLMERILRRTNELIPGISSDLPMARVKPR
jgi:hypothetical protein